MSNNNGPALVGATRGTPVTLFFDNTENYRTAMKKNRDLDRDVDGIACESR